jgi:hypothetical protein
MEPNQHKSKDHSTSSRNDFLMLFGLMLLDDEARRISAQMDEEGHQEIDILDINEDDFDEPDDDPDDEYD